MLNINPRQLDDLELTVWNSWLNQHVQTLAELLPDIAGQYPVEAWRTMVEGLLRRAEGYEMFLEQEALAYCYGCLILGLGFETRHVACRAALAGQGAARAESLWDAIEQVASTGDLA